MREHFSDACILTVSAATNGFKGCDTGHGCITELVFEHSGCDFKAIIEEEKLTINLGGDAELRTIIKALAFMADSLKTIADEHTVISLTED